MTTQTIAERTLAAEARAVEEGHRAHRNPDGSYRVVSDTRPGKHYRVQTTTPLDAGAGIIFDCHPVGNAAYDGDHLSITSAAPGAVPCKHAALVARRMEREGRARWDAGRWVASHAAAATARAKATQTQPADPFSGLPS